jgi:hypothetical protein
MNAELILKAMLITFGILYLIWVAKKLKEGLYEEDPHALSFIFNDYPPAQAFALALLAVLAFIGTTIGLAVIMPGYVVWSNCKRKS